MCTPPRWYWFVSIGLLLAFSAAGWIFGWWESIELYDEAVHFGSAVLLAPLALGLVIGNLPLSKLSTWRTALAGTLTWAGVGALWETTEWITDKIWHSANHQKGLDDTMIDLTLNSGGALLGMFIAIMLLPRRRED